MSRETQGITAEACSYRLSRFPIPDSRIPNQAFRRKYAVAMTISSAGGIRFAASGCSS